MVNCKENNVNCEILKYLKYDLKGKEIDIYELIVRAEENIKENGIIIKDKSIEELNKIIADMYHTIIMVASAKFAEAR